MNKPHLTPVASSRTNAILSRRQALTGLAALALSGCASNAPELTLRSPDELDPLSPIRLAARAGATEWASHLPPPLPGGWKVLSLSAGAEDGAFGAGALTGLTAGGRRPRFDIVTGVSTGALIAPFAFLGSHHDETLRDIFTQHGSDDLMRLSLAGGAFGTALFDTSRMAALIEAYVSPAVLADIAQRHEDGGRLFVVTTELNTSRGYVWNMGALAQAGLHELFRSVLRGSSALPGLFAPVELRFPAGDKTVREVHIDGGVEMQFLGVPSYAFTSPTARFDAGELHLLINNTLTPTPEMAPDSAIGIAQSSLTALLRSNIRAQVDAHRLYARKHGIDFTVAAVDPSAGIVWDPDERFSSDYMNALFQHGYERGSEGRLWGVGTA